jgi:protein-L-isoaspartate(D-aspartate) O-methyltransferase
MRSVPRHVFVDPEFRAKAYTDGPLPAGHGQTISQPYIVALMTALLRLQGGEKVLEVGTGSGYQAAILAERCREVVSVEVRPIDGVAAKLPPNVTLITADGRTFDTGEQFDAVLVTFAAPEIAPAWVKQLKEGGRLVIPQGKDFCRIAVYSKHGALLLGPAVYGYGKFTPEIRSN